MNYLARLKAEFSEKGLPSELTKQTKAPSVSFVGAPRKKISEIEGANEPLPDKAVEARRQRVLAMLRASPGIKYAVIVDDPDSDPVILTLAVRGAMKDGSTVTCQLLIPRERYDVALLKDWLDSHGTKVH